MVLCGLLACSLPRLLQEECFGEAQLLGSLTASGLSGRPATCVISSEAALQQQQPKGETINRTEHPSTSHAPASRGCEQAERLGL